MCPSCLLTFCLQKKVLPLAILSSQHYLTPLPPMRDNAAHQIGICNTNIVQFVLKLGEIKLINKLPFCTEAVI